MTAWVEEYNSDAAYTAEDVEQMKVERAARGYSTEDWYEFNNYICAVIADGVERFIAEGSGAPQMYSDEQWKQLCREIAEPLKAYSQDCWTEKDETLTLDRLKEAQKALAKFAYHLASWWD